MPLLDRNGYRDDSFRRLAGAETAGHPAVLVSLDDLPAAVAVKGEGQKLGVDIANTTTLDTLQPYFEALTLIGIAFPAYSDGRGFSLARRLRKAGFTGTIRAVGPLISDQFAYALACGFDEVELPEANAARQPFAQWQHDLDTFTGTYQRGYARGENILDARRAARLEGRNG